MGTFIKVKIKQDGIRKIYGATLAKVIEADSSKTEENQEKDGKKEETKMDNS